jgi:hypothetical protein
VGKPEGKRPPGWEGNIKTDLREVGLENIDWIDVAEDRDRWSAVVNAVMNFGFYKMRGIS